MIHIQLIVAAKRNSDTSFDAEVALGFMDSDCKVLKGTQQRTVQRGLRTRDEALLVATNWIEANLFPVFNNLPKAKP